MVTDTDADLIKITEDGQVTKRIIKAGVGKTPEKSDTVTGAHLDLCVSNPPLFTQSTSSAL